MAGMVQRCARCLTATKQLRLLNVQTPSWHAQRYYAQKMTAAAKTKAAAQMAAPERQYLEVEEDVEKLCNTVCGLNIYKDGQDPVLKPDSEYPEWLWELRTDRGPPPIDLEAGPGAGLDDEFEYWKRLRKLDRNKRQLTRKTRRKFKIF